MSHLFYAIARDRRIIQEELPRTAPRANGPFLTGNMLFDEEHGVVWFEFQSGPDMLKGDYRAMVTMDLPERAPIGSRLVYVNDREAALAYDESN